MIILKIVLVSALFLTFVQDLKERKIYWIWIPCIAIASGLLFYTNTLPELFLMSIVLNLCFVSILLLVIFMYARLKLKTNLKHVIGLGDVLLFITFSISFSTVSFIVTFLGALIFSLILHLALKNYSQMHTTVPLAGYMSLFFLASFLTHWSGMFVNLYAF